MIQTPGPTLAAIAFGGNVGDVLATFRQALVELTKHATVERVSRAYRTRAMTLDGAPGPDFWNAVALVRTPLPATTLLQRLHAIERAAGRERSEKWAPRTLDLDLLLFGDALVSSGTLVVPHPGLRERLFVLAPLNDVAPDYPVPPDGIRVAALYEERRAVGEAPLEVRDSWT